MYTIRRIILGLVLAALIGCGLAAKVPARAAAADVAPAATAGRHRAMGMLKDSHICASEDYYYLVGTGGTEDKRGAVDYDYNRGVPLWRSRDLKEWENMGLAWDRVEHFDRTNGQPKIGVWRDWGAPAGRIDGLQAQATTTPELHHINGDWYILCAMNGRNIILQKSTSGQPEGPYEDHAYFVTRGGDPSFFVDDDETVYLIYADGWIAEVKEDLTALAEEPRPMRPQPADSPGQAWLTLGDAGMNMFKRDGRYCVLAARWTVRQGKPAHDAVLWVARSVYGPYRETKVTLKDTGPVSVFQHADGGWMAVSSRPVDTKPRIIPVPREK